MPRQLTPENEALVDHIVAIGDYEDGNQVIADALRLLAERERRLHWLRAELKPALDQEERGDLIDVTLEYVEDIQRRALESAHQGKPVRDAVKP